MIKPTNPFDLAEIARSYDTWYESPLGAAADTLEKALIYRLARPLPKEAALDVGTGTGHFACELADMGLRVTAIDPSEAMLNVARAKRNDIVWQRAAAEALPFSDNSFDLVLSVTTLEFVQDPGGALREMYRVTKPKGRLVVATLNRDSSWGQMYLEQARLGQLPFRDARLLSADDFQTLVSQLGPVRWNSAVFFPPSGRGMAWRHLLEGIGQRLNRRHGALLVARIDK